MRYQHSVCISMTGRWSCTTYHTISMHIPTAITSILTELSAQGKKLHAWASSCVMTQNVNRHLRYHTNTLSWNMDSCTTSCGSGRGALRGWNVSLNQGIGGAFLFFIFFFFSLKLKLSQNSSTHNTICACWIAAKYYRHQSSIWTRHEK